jgi:hypothetical protein
LEPSQPFRRRPSPFATSPIPPIHYWSDNAVTTVLRHLDVPILASRRYAWQHHWEQAGRISGTGEQADAERVIYSAFERDTIINLGRNL